MKKVIIFVLIILNIYSFKAFNLQDLCFTKSTCNEEFAFECNKNYCSKHNQTCQILEINMNSIGIMKAIFISSVNHCEHKWRPSDVCLKEKTCFENKLKLLFGPKLDLISDKDNCMCKNKHPIKCNNKFFCGRDKRGCDGLKINNLIQICGINIIFLIFFVFLNRFIF